MEELARSETPVNTMNSLVFSVRSIPFKLWTRTFFKIILTLHA